MEFRILGPLEVLDEQGVVALGGTKPRAVLAVLLLHANEPVGAERLASALWGDDAPAHAIKTVQVHVSRLRKALGDPAIVTTTPAGYRLRVRPGELDAHRFAEGVDEGRAALDAGDPERAATVLREALALWRGPPLADLAFEPFAPREIARLEEERLVALELRLEADLARGRHDALAGELQQLAAEHPTREGLARLRMLALYRSGRQAEALEVYRDLRHVLVSEVGVEPGVEVRRLQDAILRQDPSLELPEPVLELPARLEPDSASPLIGRDTPLARLREHWEHARKGMGRLVALVGAQGMGTTRLAAELAGEVHRQGAVVLYAAASDPREAISAMLHRAREAPAPVLVILDDAHLAGAQPLATLAELAGHQDGAPVLALAAGREEGELGSLDADDRVRLDPLNAEAVRAVAAHALPDWTGDPPPAELLEQSGGVPGRVHELVKRWARREAARHVGTVAERTAAGRAQLRSMETELTGGVLALRAAHERYGETGGDELPVVCPFKGLASYDVVDAPFFFGRERLVAELVARLVGAPLLGVMGPSGSGKSSVVRAGLLPALAQGVLPGSATWGQVVIRPGDHPLRELHRAIGDRGGERRVVVVVDQFEETFTTCRDEDERAAFIAELTADGGASQVVVLAIRADHYGRCAAYPKLSRLLADHHVLVGAMRHDELRRAVERPARRAGLHVDPDLVDVLVADVEHEPGALPILSTALLELWQHRDGRRLSLSTYEATGGVRGAVARHAEDAFARLGLAERAVARRTLLRLVTDDGAGGVERRRVPLADLDPDGNEAAAGVIALLADERLLTVTAGAVELAHEALLREWPRLRGWLEEDAHGRRLHRHLADSAREWEQRGRDPADLYRGARLAAALEWRRDHEPELNPAELAFLEAARAAEESELAAAHRRARRLRVVAAGLAVLVLVAGASALLAARQTRRATLERSTAVSRSLAIEAVAHLRDDFVLAALLGVEAYRAHPTVEARSAALSGLSELGGTSRVLGRHGNQVSSLAFSAPDGTLASADYDGLIRLWDVTARRPLGGPLDNDTDWVRTIAISPDGRTLVAGGPDPALRLWDLRARRPLGPPIRTRMSTVNVAFGPDGRTVATADDDGALRLWDVHTRREVRQLSRSLRYIGGNYVLGVAFSPDGRTLAGGLEFGEVRLWDLDARHSVAHSLSGHTNDVRGVAFSPDGRTVATGGADETVRFWDARVRRPMGEPLTGHTDRVHSVAFSPDGRTLASASADRTVRLWDVRARRPLGQPLRGHRGQVRSVAFSPDGRTLASAGDDRAVRLWNDLLWSDDRREIERRVCTVIRRSLTRAQWSEFLPGEQYRETCPS